MDPEQIPEISCHTREEQCPDEENPECFRPWRLLSSQQKEEVSRNSIHTQEKKSDEGMTITFPDVMAPGHGLKIYVEPMALMNVIGTTMDYKDGEMASEFTFTNPNSKGECGCGESFNV